MSDLPDGESGWGLAPPPFDAPAALQVLRRAMRDARLAERGAPEHPRFELRGRAVAELQVQADGLQASMARRPALTPQWDRQRIASTEQQRRWLAELKKRLERWESEE